MNTSMMYGYGGVSDLVYHLGSLETLALLLPLVIGVTAYLVYKIFLAGPNKEEKKE